MRSHRVSGSAPTRMRPTAAGSNDKTLLTRRVEKLRLSMGDNFCEHRDYYVGQMPFGSAPGPGMCGQAFAWSTSRAPAAATLIRKMSSQSPTASSCARPAIARSISCRQAWRAHPFSLSAHESADARMPRHGQPPRSREGEVLGASAINGREAGGTTYHLLSTRRCRHATAGSSSIVYELVAAYRGLIGVRGQVVNDAMFLRRRRRRTIRRRIIDRRCYCRTAHRYETID